ncbi:hypothetical protein [Luteimonas lutimaris]|uniref:Uncharacterized protein n=1 Tax=Luteimonas lutimaris TaxID=698645 RepID=A0ABP7MR72_9GAMM
MTARACTREEVEATLPDREQGSTVYGRVVGEVEVREVTQCAFVPFTAMPRRYSGKRLLLVLPDGK